MPEPSRIRARVKDGVTDVHVLMIHPMETGLRKDAAGQYPAAHYITDVRISCGGRPVLTATLSRSVSQDPLLHFRFRGGEPGAKIAVTWVDSRGERRADEGVIQA